MFHVIFTTIFQNSISTVTIPFSTEEEADEAILHFEDQSTTYIGRKATRLYRESFEFKVEWTDGVHGTLTDVVRGYTRRQVGDDFIEKHKIPINNLIDITEIEKKSIK